ncbi:MAG TPA: ABC transporter permease [Flavitalea sp.]|nr:ABC transporter permease [Flavitalea sp.]
MIKHYLKIALRNLSKNKTYSAINITGLAVGLAGFIIILLYLDYELSYDTWADSLNQVCKISSRTDEDIQQQTPAPLSSFLKQHSPAVEAATTCQPAGDFEILLSAGDKKIYQRGGVEADSSFLKVFPYKLVKGNPATALDKPNAIVISEEVAGKLFGNTDPVGKTIRIFNVVDCEVTAVVEQPGKPSHLNAQFIYRSPYEKQNTFWENYSYLTYVKTKQTMPVKKLEQEVNRIYHESRLKKDNQSLESFRKAGHTAGLFVDAVKDIHNFPEHGTSNFKTVSVLLLLAALLLLVGAINFSNLSIAASVRRAKEVGVRKVLGSNKKQLIWQFMSEAGLQCLISLCLALGLVRVILPYFNSLFSIDLDFLQSGNVLLHTIQLSLCLLTVIVISGIYPALFLSRYNTTKVLKGDYSTGVKGNSFRNALIVVQFTVSAFFIIATLIISRQMNYMQTMDKGFSGERVIRLETSQKTREADFETVRTMLLTIPGVQYISKTTTIPGDPVSDTATISYKHNGQEYRMASVKVSTDYFRTLDIAPVQGSLFDHSYADQNTRTAIINEAAARKLNVQNPVGATITFPHCDTVPVRVAGVVENFNVSGFENAVQPVVFTIGNRACMYQSGGAILVKLNSVDIQGTVARIEHVWKSIEPDFPIRYSFLDDNFQKLFASYARLQLIMNFFGGTAILISMMGLFALTAFLTGQRTKEIGIRKILGAGVGNLSILMSKDFMRLVLIAILIAVPLGWWAGDQWLQSFVYRAAIDGWIFVAAALIVVMISIFTIGIQTIKVAAANPVKSLRRE